KSVRNPWSSNGAPQAVRAETPLRRRPRGGAAAAGLKLTWLPPRQRACYTPRPCSLEIMDESWMAEALAEARRAAAEGEVPIGSVVVFEDRIVGRGRNARERLRDPLAHAEILALQEAARSLGRWRLTGATIYATLEPCPMCAGALVNARIDRLVYAVPDPKAGAAGTLFQIPRDPRLNHRIEVASGVLAKECGDLLTQFFHDKRGR